MATSHDPHDLNRFVEAQRQVSQPGSVFHRLLERYCGGQPDRLTLERLSAGSRHDER